jgi:hypothetical protein
MSIRRVASCFLKDKTLMQTTARLDKPGYTRVEIHSVVRADASPCYHVTSNCCSKPTNLCRCGGCSWARVVDKMFSTDNRDNNEDHKAWNPNTVFEPAEGQGAFRDGGEIAHQLRTLSPQKDTYP